MYLAYDDVTEYSFAEIFFFVITTVLLAIVLLNMIIAMMNDTFNSVQGKRALSDGKEKVYLILENFVMQRNYQVLCRRRKLLAGKKRDCSVVKYLFYVEQSKKKDQISDTHALKTAIEGIQKDLKTQVKIQARLEERQLNMEEKVERQNQKLLQRQSEFENKIIGKIEELQENMNQIVSLFSTARKPEQQTKSYQGFMIENST